MPKGIPTAEQLMSGTVRGFSIDTCIFESLGFNLETGEFGVLRQQLPPWLTLYIPSIVKREVVGHQVINVHRSEQEIKTSIRNIHRYSGVDIGAISTAVEEMQLATVAKIFEDRLRIFIHKFNGSVVAESGDKLLQEMFERYFNSRPPFESKKDKKNEFPDAASLLALEYLAKKQKKLFVLVSNDDGWGRFCDQSEVLFCVKKLEELTALYQAESGVVAAIEARIVESLNDTTSEINKEIESGLEKSVPDCSWIVEAYTGYCSRVDPELDFAEFKEFIPNVDSLRLWLSNNGEEICVVELEVKVECNFGVSAEFSTWDSIDHEDVPVGIGSTEFSDEVVMTVYLTLSGDLSGGNPNNWEIQFEISQQDYWINAGEMEPDYSGYEE
ncbi:MAG: PIN domain-containing protein [Gallionella sp.]|nr:PIN domain-containing protein [Gallionella sp.]